MNTRGMSLVAVGVALGLGVVGGKAAGAVQGSDHKPEPRSLARVIPIAVYVNGERLGTDALMIKGVGAAVLPMRDLFNALGAKVVWNARQNAIYAWKPDGTGVRFVIGKRTADLLLWTGSGTEPADQGEVTEARRIDVPPLVIDGRVYVPVRAAVEALDAEIGCKKGAPALYLDTDPNTTLNLEETPVARKE